MEVDPVWLLYDPQRSQGQTEVRPHRPYGRSASGLLHSLLNVSVKLAFTSVLLIAQCIVFLIR